MIGWIAFPLNDIAPEYVVGKYCRTYAERWLSRPLFALSFGLSAKPTEVKPTEAKMLRKF